MANPLKAHRQRWQAQIRNGKDIRCGICKLRFGQFAHPWLGPLTVDHIIPKFLGGTNHRENLQPAHKLCNSRRGHILLEEFQEALNQQNVLLHALQIIERDKMPSIEELLRKVDQDGRSDEMV